MCVRGTAVDAGELTEFCHEFIRTTHGTGESPADAEVKLAGGLLAESGVESDNFDDLDRSDIELLGDPLDGFGTDEAMAVLDFVEQRENGRATLVVGILGDSLVRLFFEFWSGFERREIHGAGSDR